MKKLVIAILSIISVVVCATSALSAEVTLQWNAVAEADWYKVYHGTESRVYVTPDEPGAVTTYTLTLDPGTYYFAVTAGNNYGESGYSEEAGPTTIGAGINPPINLTVVTQPNIRGITLDNGSLLLVWVPLSVPGINYRIYNNDILIADTSSIFIFIANASGSFAISSYIGDLESEHPIQFSIDGNTIIFP